MTTWMTWPGSLLTNCLRRLPWTTFGVSSPVRVVLVNWIRLVERRGSDQENI